MPQFMRDDTDEPPKKPTATLIIKADTLDGLRRLLNVLEAFEQFPGIEITAKADGLVETFYGYEFDVWTHQNP